MSKRKTIFRRPHVSKFFSVDRVTAQNKDLSYEAAGMLTYILSKPDTWEVRPSDLERKGCGRNRVYRLLNELIAARYIVRDVERDDNGKITAFIYIVHETPFPENQEMANQEMENGDNRYNREEESTEKIISAPKTGAESAPRKTNPNEPLFNALVQAFGFLPSEMKGKGGKSYWVAAADLKTQGVDAEDIPGLYRYVKTRAETENWRGWTVMALPKYVPDWRKAGNPSGDDPYAEMFRGLKFIVAGEK